MNARNIARFFAAAALAIIMTGAASPLVAQDAPHVPDVVQQHLWPLVGNWRGEAKMTVGGTTTTFPYTHKSMKTAGGFGLQVIDGGTIPGMGAYTGTNLFGYDAGTGTLHLFTVDNVGDVHDHAGKWAGEKNVVLRYEGISEGKPMVEIITIDFDGPRQYSFKSVVTVGGEPYQTFEATMKR
jgi:hypothetical protein